MAYFGDTLAHGALLGAGLSLAFDVSALLAVLLVGVVLSLLLILLQRRKDLSSDTLLGIMAHGALAVGLVLLAMMQNQGMRVDLMAYLFGDILAVSWSDIGWMALAAVLVIAGLARIWRSLLSIAVHEELARSEGVRVDLVAVQFMLLIAVVVAVAMKLVGILLITALLIIPAATARRYARSPESMALLAVLAGVLAVLLGLWSSLQWDSPTGPSIVVAAALLFFLSRLKRA
jgi:zinc transport system permease protein